MKLLKMGLFYLNISNKKILKLKLEIEPKKPFIFFFGSINKIFWVSHFLNFKNLKIKL